MIIISHRGNLIGPQPELENHPTQILKALSLGFDVEVDVRFSCGEFLLGHDSGQYEVDGWFLKNPRLWCHAKDFDSLKSLLEIEAHCFYHTDEDFVLTSQNKIWSAAPEGFSSLQRASFLVCPNRNMWDGNPDELDGICTDFPVDYKSSIPKSCRARALTR